MGCDHEQFRLGAICLACGAALAVSSPIVAGGIAIAVGSIWAGNSYGSKATAGTEGFVSNTAGFFLAAGGFVLLLGGAYTMISSALGNSDRQKED